MFLWLLELNLKCYKIIYWKTTLDSISGTCFGPSKRPNEPRSYTPQSSLYLIQYIKTVHTLWEGTQSLISNYTLFIFNLELTWALECKPCWSTPRRQKGSEPPLDINNYSPLIILDSFVQLEHPSLVPGRNIYAICENRHIIPTNFHIQVDLDMKIGFVIATGITKTIFW